MTSSNATMQHSSVHQRCHITGNMARLSQGFSKTVSSGRCGAVSATIAARVWYWVPRAGSRLLSYLSLHLSLFWSGIFSRSDPALGGVVVIAEGKHHD